MILPAPYTHTDGRILLLGKDTPKIDNRTFQLKDFLSRATPPPSANWYQGITSWGMMLNDTLGDCTCAAIGHAKQVSTLNTPDGEETPPDVLILNLYEKSCGYVNGDPSTDQGGIIVNVLNYVRKYRLGKHKHWLYAFADPDPGDVEHIKQAIATFGIVDIGLQLPITAQNQVGSTWDVVGNPNTDPNSQPGSWGGHSVIVSSYGTNGLTCITWGALQTMTWEFWSTYVDESHALLMKSWMQSSAVQSGVNLAAMESALQALNN